MLILLILLILLIPSDVHAYAAAAAIVAYIGVAAAYATAATIALTAVLTIAAGFAMSALSQLLAGGAEEGNARTQSSRGQLINTCDSQLPLPLVYGRQRIGINRVYAGLSGDDNKYLHIIGTLCEGEIEGLVSIAGVPQLFLSDKIYTDYGDSVYYEFFIGSSTQSVCASLHAAIPEWTDPLKNTAYIYIRLSYDADKFQNVPEITCLIDGLKIYNPATSTTAFSNNPAFCARDFMARTSKRGGMEINALRSSDDLVIGSASYCTTKGWTCDICLLDNNAAVDNLQQILSCFRGDVIYGDVEFKMKYTDLNYEASVMDINEDDIIENGGASTLTIVQPDIFDTPNAVKIKYVNADKKYQLDDYILSDPAAVLIDGDYREKEIYLRGTVGQATAMKMANYFLERLRANKSITFGMGSRGMALEPFDIIRVSVAAYGWALKMFRVLETHATPEGTVAISAVEEFATFYDDTYNITPRTWHDTLLPSPMDMVFPVTNAAMTEEVYYYRERSYTRLKVTFAPPLPEVYPQWEYADIYVKIGAGDWKFMTKAVSSYNIDPVEEGQEYHCKIVSVSCFGSKQAFDDGMGVSKIVQGPLTGPGDVTSFQGVAAGDSIILYATPLDEPNIAVYELRQGDTWAGGVVVALNETPNFRLTGVKPGTFKFYLAARDNAGLYSANPIDAQVIVFYPPGYVAENSWAWNFNGIGSFVNTEHVTYDGGDALKCSHTGGVLTGTWTSPEYDLGSVKTVRVWSDLLTAFSSPAGTFASIFDTKTFTEVLVPSTIKFYQLTEPVISGAIRATIKWGTSSGVYPDSADKFELSSVEFEARYIQIVITITDPTVDANLYLKTLNNIAAIAVDRV